MKKFVPTVIHLFLILLLISSTAYATDWRFPVGVSYVGNFNKVVDIHEDNLEAEGFEVDTTWQFPFGLTFQPYVEFDFGLGMGLGPMMIIVTSEEADFFNLPINVNARYSFIPKNNISPYVRAGASYNIASGDYVDSSKIGFLGAVGVEFSRKSAVGYGFEVGYDSSEIEFDDFKKGGTKDIKPINWWASIFVVF